MSKYARDFRRLVRLSIALFSIASANGLAAQTPLPATGFADAIVLPQYYSGMGRIMVHSGIESARPTQLPQPIAQLASQVTGQPTSQNPVSGDIKLTGQGSVAPSQPIQQPVAAAAGTQLGGSVNSDLGISGQVTIDERSSLGQPVLVQPNQDSQLQRRTAPQESSVPKPRDVREVQPQREQPQLRREQPQVAPGVPSNQASGDQPRPEANRVREERREPSRDNDKPKEEARSPGDRGPDRAPGDRGPDRDPGDRGPGDRGPSDRGQGGRASNDRGIERNDGPMSNRPGFGGPGFGGPGFGGPGFGGPPGSMPGQGPWMRGGMDGGQNSGSGSGVPNFPPNRQSSGPGSGLGSGPPHIALGQDLDLMDRIFNSPAVRQFLQLKEENLQLKSELKMKERELEMKMEMTEMRLRMHMQEAEKRVDQANQQVEEMRKRGAPDEEAMRQRAATFQRMRDSGSFSVGGKNFTPGEQRELAEGARPNPKQSEQLLLELKEKAQDAAKKLGSDHPSVVEMKKRISAERELLGKPQQEAFDLSNDLRDAARADDHVKKESEESQKSLERVTLERNRVVAELESVLKQSADLKRKLEAVSQEKASMEKSLIEAKRSAEKQFEKAKQAAEQAAKVEKEEVSKKEEAEKEKPAKRKKEKDEGDKAEGDKVKGDDGDK